MQDIVLPVARKHVIKIRTGQILNIDKAIHTIGTAGLPRGKIGGNTACGVVICNGIVPGTAINCVVTGPAAQHIVTSTTGNHVVSDPAAQNIIIRTAIKGIVARTALKAVRARPARKNVVAAPPCQHIVAVIAAQAVIIAIAGDGIGKCRSVNILDRCQMVDFTARLGGGAIFKVNHNTFGGGIIGHIPACTAIKAVISGPADQRIIACPGQNHIIAATAGNHVISGLAVDQFGKVGAGNLVGIFGCAQRCNVIEIRRTQGIGGHPGQCQFLTIKANNRVARIIGANGKAQGFPVGNIKP